MSKQGMKEILKPVKVNDKNIERPTKDYINLKDIIAEHEEEQETDERDHEEASLKEEKEKEIQKRRF